MAVNPPPDSTGSGVGVILSAPERQQEILAARTVSPWRFVGLKLRVMGNGLRGQRWRIALFVIGVVVGLWFAVMGFLLFSAPGFAHSESGALLLASFGGTILVLGWLLMPLVFFGVDETLDPARFALLPLEGRTMVGGMFAAALVGIPALATLLASAGLVISMIMLGGWLAGYLQVFGVIGGLLLCVALSRAVTSAFATMLRSRRVRDLAAIMLAVLAALLGPLQIALLAATRNADWSRFTGLARVLGWTPFAAPFTVGMDVVEGRLWAAPLKLLITVGSIAGLLWWWSRTLESAMVGTVDNGRARASAGAPGTATAQLFPRSMQWLPRTRAGALAAREARYWWRDTRRRANLITFAVVGFFVPVMVNIGSRGLIEGERDTPSSLITASGSMIFVGVLGAVGLANQFGYDGTAYAANIVAGVPGRAELRARLVGFTAYVAPLLLLIPVVLALVLGEPTWIPAMLGAVVAAFGCGLAVNLFVSVFGAYALPETANPFAVNTGAGITKSLFSFAAMIGTLALSVPIILGAIFIEDIWLWVALPIGLAYGIGAALFGCYLAGDALDRRMPELLSEITPRR